MAGQKNFEQTTQEMMQAYLSSDYEGALEISEQACIDFPEQIALPLIWRISLLSRLNRVDESLRLFADCLEEGYWWPRAFFEDEDLDNVRELPEFQRLVDASYERSLEESDKHAPKRFIVEPSKDTTAPLPLLITMHGMGHDGQSELDFWGKASEAGWLVASLQSSQLYSMTGFCWDDLAKAEQELLDHFSAICKEYEINQEQIVLGGFSQGAGLAIQTSLSGRIPAAGFIGVGTWAPEVETIAELAKTKPPVRGYFVIGEKDHTLESANKIQTALTEAGLQLDEERHSDLGHEFPADPHETLRRALHFITSK